MNDEWWIVCIVVLIVESRSIVNRDNIGDFTHRSRSIVLASVSSNSAIVPTVSPHTFQCIFPSKREQNARNTLIYQTRGSLLFKTLLWDATDASTAVARTSANCIRPKFLCGRGSLSEENKIDFYATINISIKG